ncbi:hypothetical protein EV2_034421 [Malus domestica]
MQEQATELLQAFGITNQAPAEIYNSFPVKLEQPESSHVRNAATSSSPNLSLIENQPMQNRMLAVLKRSTDPANLFLKLMQESFNEHWGKGGVGFEEYFMKSHISMLNDLMKVRPDVGPIVKEDAIKLAVQWQAKMRADIGNSLEILGFLQFIATYGILSTLNGDDIVKLLGVLCQHKQATKLCQTLDFADKILPDVVQNLIERKQVIDAVKFMCAFKLNGKFSPALLLKDYVEDARKSYHTIWLEEESLDEKDEILGNQIAELRDLIRYIKDHNLESEFPFKDVESEIVKLEQLKENSGSSMPSVVPKDEPEHEKGKRRSSRSSIRTEPEQCRKSKRLRQMKEEP